MPDLDRILSEFPQLGDLLPTAPPTCHAGFSGAVVYRVTTAAGTFALRAWPAGWELQRLVGLHALLTFLRDCGLHFVAAPIRSFKGTTCVDCDGVWVQAEPWLPGVADYHQRPDRTRLTNALVALARWHQTAARFAPARPHRQWFHTARADASPAVLERRNRLRSINAATVQNWRRIARHHAGDSSGLIDLMTAHILRLAEAVLAQLDVAASVTVPLQPVLRDVWHDHLLFTDDAVTGLIDPSACRTESVAADLARLIGSLCGNDPAEWDVALRAYQQIRPLSAAELGLAPVLDRSGVLLAGVTWLEWLGPQRRFQIDDPRVLPRLQEILQRLAGW